MHLALEINCGGLVFGFSVGLWGIKDELWGFNVCIKCWIVGL